MLWMICPGLQPLGLLGKKKEWDDRVQLPLSLGLQQPATEVEDLSPITEPSA
jgi:hypothetical protein